MNTDWGNASWVALIGFAGVFAILIILYFAVLFTAKVVGNIEKKSSGPGKSDTTGTKP